MKCKRLCAAILSLVMIISLLPTTALAAEIPAEYKPTIEWTDIGSGTIDKYTLTVNVYYEGKYVGTDSSGDKHLSAKVTVPSTMEVQKYEVTGHGCAYSNVSKLFTFTSHVFGGSTEGTLNLYLRSKAGHTVTVNYVYTDDESKNGSKSENVKYAEEKSFGKLEKDYGYEITVSSDDVKYEVNSLNELWVTGGAEDSEITVTYTPKDVIYIDQYYDNGSSLVKWNNTHITLNGPDLLKNNAAEAAVIEKTVLTDDMEDYRFLTVNGVTYDFSFASLVPRKDDTWVITDLWYKDEADPLGYHWFYSHSGKTVSIPWGKSELSKGSVNFCYNTPHTEKSEYHDFVATTVDPTCTEGGYTDYECRYCGKTKRDDFTNPLDHDWGTYVHVEGTDKEASQHYQVCQRKGCNATSTPVGCNFVDTSIETGTRHTCKDCGYSYTDEITPTGTPVYVYFKTVHPKDGDVQVKNKSVIYNNNTGANWATLGKLTTTTDVTKANAADIGNEVKTSSNFKKHDSNKDFDLALINKWVELKQDNGAAGYDDAPTWAWHLNGQVNVCKLSYDANLPDGVGEDAVTGMPKPAYYLPN